MFEGREAESRISGTALWGLGAHGGRLYLLDAATALFDQTGAPLPSLEALALATDAPLGLVRHCFGSSEDLTRDVIYGVLDELGERALPHLDLPLSEAAAEVIQVFREWCAIHHDFIANATSAVETSATLSDALADARSQVLRLMLNQIGFQDIDSAPNDLTEATTEWIDAVTHHLGEVARNAAATQVPTAGYSPPPGGGLTLQQILDRLERVLDIAEGTSGRRSRSLRPLS